MSRPPTLVLITGLPGAGKSTVAEAAADHLGAAVLGWDWAMAGLTPFEPIQGALRTLDRASYADVGWSLLGNLATQQLRLGRSVVLDGVARDAQVASVRALAAREGARLLVVLVRCPDEATHRRRIEGRRRDIPGWHELQWSDVARSRAGWVEPGDLDLVLDTTSPPEQVTAELAAVLAP